MKFAFGIVKDIVTGDARTRVNAVATIGIWFAAGAFIVSTVSFYFAEYENVAADFVGGVVFAAVATTAKLA